MRQLFAGIDSGSWNTKAVIIDAEANRLGGAIVRSGADLVGAAQTAFAQACEAANLTAADIRDVWSTGFGRHLLRNNLAFIGGTRTELDCHARGVHHHIRAAVTVIDIGGQDAKVIQIAENGQRISHKMNRKCAAGTGSFLEEMALRLGVVIDELPTLAARFAKEINLGSFCTVFTATELLSAIRQGELPADLARAAYKSVVKRVLEMATIAGQVAATGGVVAHHPMVVDLLSEALFLPVTVPPHAQEMGAFGAALAAFEATTFTENRA